MFFFLKSNQVIIFIYEWQGLSQVAQGNLKFTVEWRLTLASWSSASTSQILDYRHIPPCMEDTTTVFCGAGDGIWGFMYVR